MCFSRIESTYLESANLWQESQVLWHYGIINRQASIAERFIRIFTGVRWRVSQMRVGSLKMTIFASFARHIFPTFTHKATIIIL